MATNSIEYRNDGVYYNGRRLGDIDYGGSSVESSLSLGLDDEGYNFVNTDTDEFKRWNGSSWDVLLPSDYIQSISSSTDNNVPQWDGTSGKLLKNGLAVGTGAGDLVQLDGSSRLPAVDGSQLTNLPSGGGTGISFYTPTLQDAINTTVKTTVLSFSVPGGEWQNGQEIYIHPALLSKNNSGGDVVHEYEIGFGSSFSITRSTTTPTNTGEGKIIPGMCAVRVNNDIWVNYNSTPFQVLTSWLSRDFYVSNMGGLTFSGIDFSTTINFVLNVTFDTAHTEVYLKPQTASIYKIG